MATILSGALSAYELADRDELGKQAEGPRVFLRRQARAARASGAGWTEFDDLEPDRTADADRLRRLMLRLLASRARRSDVRKFTREERLELAAAQERMAAEHRRLFGQELVFKVTEEFDSNLFHREMAQTFITAIFWGGLHHVGGAFRELGIEANDQLVDKVTDTFLDLAEKDIRRRSGRRPDAEQYVRRGLQAMGYPTDLARAFYRHLDRRTATAEKKAAKESSE